MPSAIICTLCNVPVDACTCEGQDARLKEASNSIHVAFKWCRTCDKHYARCKCETPDFYVRSGGKEIPVPRDGFRNVEGSRTNPDLSKR